MTAARWSEADVERVKAKVRGQTTAPDAGLAKALDVIAALPVLEKKPNKYGAHRIEVDGLTFDSKKEARRWQELQLLQHAGQIEALDRQVRFSLEVNGVHIADYVCDFWYLQDGKRVVEDVKSAATSKIQAYRIKRKLMLAIHGIEIKEL